MPDLKTKQVAAPVLKFADMPDDVQKQSVGLDADLYVYATVERADREGDVVRVKGIDTESFAKNGAIKFLISHQRGPMADGRLPVLGKVAKWIPTKHKGTGDPALVAAIKFAPTPLAQETRKLYDEGFLTDVSIGFQPTKATPIKDGGYDYESCSVAEISACVTGMNDLAGVVRALDHELNLGKPGDLPQGSVHEPVVKLGTLSYDIKYNIDPEENKKHFAPLLEKLDAIFEQAKSLHETYSSQLKAIASRLDDLEDSMSNLPKGADPQVDRTAQQPPKKIDADKIVARLSL